MEFEEELQGIMDSYSKYSIHQLTSFTTLPPFSNDDSLQIRFLLSCWCHVSIRHQNSTQIIPCNPLVKHSSISLSLSQFHDYQQTYTLFYQNSKDWPILHPHVSRGYIFDNAYIHAKGALRSMPPGHTHLYVQCGLVVHHNIVIRPIPNAVMIPADDLSIMIPADDLSIEALETLNVSSGSCSICLEEFCEGGDLGASMPCQHVFHRDCLSKWLGISHFCPICRFQMPPAY